MPRYFHVTSSLNRDSIERHGLDWRRMGPAHGLAAVAGYSMTPEVEGIFLCEDESEVEWFAHMGLEQGHESLDVWEVIPPAGIELVESQEGYRYIAQPIPPEALRLHTRGWTARSPASVAGDLFHGIYYGEGEVNTSLLDANVAVPDMEGTRSRGVQAAHSWARNRSHGTPSAPKPDSDGVIRVEISNATGFSIEGVDDELSLISPITADDYWTLVRVRDNVVTEIMEFRTRSDVSEVVDLEPEY